MSAPVFVPGVARDGVQVVPLPGVPGEVLAQGVDARVAGVSRILAGRPLEPWSGAIVSAAGRYPATDALMVAAISVWESGGGEHVCGFNAWGWGSCLGDNFGSWEEGIERVARALSEAPYAGLDARGKLCMWQSGDGGCGTEEGSAYAARVMATMEVGR